MATCMSRGSSSLQLLRICLHGARLSSSVAAGVQDTKAREQSDSLRHQFFLSGVRFLKNDPDKLKSNLKKRRITLDVDRMVCVAYTKAEGLSVSKNLINIHQVVTTPF